MKLQNLAAVFFALALPFFAQAQIQTSARSNPEQDQLAQQRGDLENFKNLFSRFNLALEEHEQESVDVLKTALLEIMRQKIVQVEKTQQNQPSQPRQARLERQHKLLETLSKTPFSSQNEAAEKAAFEKAHLFTEFVQQMEQEFSELEAAGK